MRNLKLNNLKPDSDLPFKISNGGGIIKKFDQQEWHDLLKSEDLWAIEIGSITKETRPGNSGNVWQFPLNSLGMPNPGVEYYRKALPDAVTEAHDAGKLVIVNIAGFSIDEYAELAELTFHAGADIIILNGGCPNVIAKGGGRKPIISLHVDATDELFHRIEQCLGSNKNILYKVSPYSDPELLHTMAGVIRSTQTIAGVVAVNTFPNAWDCNPRTGDPILSVPGGYGGMSGVLQIALGQVRQWRDKLPDHTIFGVGGIWKGEDLMKFRHAGADAFQMTSAILEKGVGVVSEVLADAATISEPV